MKRVKEHNTRQWALHNYFKNHPFEYTKRIDILCALKEYYFEKHVTEFDIRTDDIYFSTAGALLNKDIKAIKFSTVIKRILIGNRNGLKYATKEEAEEYFKREDEAIEKRCKVNNWQKSKYGLHGQRKLVFANEKPEVESLMEG